MQEKCASIFKDTYEKCTNNSTLKKSIEEIEYEGEDWTNQKFYDIILIENKNKKERLYD